MNAPLKIIRIGNSSGLILPKEILARLGVSQGDSLYLSETEDGEYRLKSVDPEFMHKLEIAETIMRSDRNILRELAK